VATPDVAAGVLRVSQDRADDRPAPGGAQKVERPAGHRPDDILALLDTLPDLRPALKNATEDEFADIFDAFDASITYDKPLVLAAARARSHDPPRPRPRKLQNDDDRPEGRSLISGVAGEGLKHKPATAIRAWAVWDLAGKRWLREGFW
jgi:hypothetical protein